MDDEDELLKNKTSDISSNDLLNCKSPNASLSSLESISNGVLTVTNNLEDKSRSQNAKKNPSFDDPKEEKKEACGNDTEETIKKIKEFIAMGRCEDSKKDQDSSDKGVRHKSGPLLKKKDLSVKESPKTRNIVSSEISKIGRELERTLSGQDSCFEYPEASEDDLVSDDIDLNRVSNSRKDSEVENDVSIKNNDLVTPSRISKRIQSKSVKFSAKKMLRGDDVNVLKRMIPGYEDELPAKKERLTERPVKREFKKIQVTKILGSAPEASEKSSPNHGDDEKEVPEKEIVSELQPSVDKPVETPEDKTTLESLPSQISPESSPEASLPGPSEHNDSTQLSENKPFSLAEKLGKIGSVSSGKITLELKGTSQKKVVRIAIPPQTATTPLPKTSLGPDIIIKRVKPVKKTIVIPENTKLTSKNAIEKIIEDHRPPPPPPPMGNSKPSKFPFSIVEKAPVPKVKGSHILLPRNILKRGRPPKHLNLETNELKNNVDTGNSEKLPSPQKSPQASEQESNQGSKEVQDSTVKEAQIEKPSLTQQIAEALESSVSILEETLTRPKEDVARRKGVRGRRPIAKTSPFSHKSKSESLPRRVGRPRKVEVQEKSPVSSDAEEPEENEVESIFDKYFTTRERYVEHHDSLDSDSSDDYDNEIFSHFINFRMNKKVQQEKREDSTMYDIMSSISAELPSWNIHVSSNGEIFYLAQIDTSDDVPTMKKVIEIDLQYNTKVFVNGALIPESEVNVSSYEDIKQLVYDVDQL